MDEAGVDRMRTETLAAAMHLTTAELKAKLRAAGVADPTPIGKVDGMENPAATSGTCSPAPDMP